MNQSMLIVVLATLSLSGLAQSLSSSWWITPYDTQDMSQVFDTLTKFEAAYKEKREPSVDHFDLSHVANVVKGLDPEGLRFVKENLPLINVLVESITKHGKLSELNPQPWHSICDEQCAAQVIADYQANRPTELTSDVHNFSGSKCEELSNILLEKDSTPLTDEHIHEAMREYKAYIDGMHSDNLNNPLWFYLYNVERTVDYTNRFAGRLVSAMWPVYNFRSEYENFASSFKHSVYEMLHANGYGVRNGEVVKVPKSFKEFIP